MYYKLKFVILFLRFVHNMFFISVKQGKKMSFFGLKSYHGLISFLRYIIERGCLHGTCVYLRLGTEAETITSEVSKKKVNLPCYFLSAPPSYLGHIKKSDFQISYLRQHPITAEQPLCVKKTHTQKIRFLLICVMLSHSAVLREAKKNCIIRFSFTHSSFLLLIPSYYLLIYP